MGPHIETPPRARKSRSVNNFFGEPPSGAPHSERERTLGSERHGMLLEVLGVGSFSRKHIVYDKAAGRGAAGLNGVVDSRPLPQAVGFGPFCARAPAELRSAHLAQWRSVNVSSCPSRRRGRLPRRRVARPPCARRERELLLTAIPRRIHRISSDLRS